MSQEKKISELLVLLTLNVAILLWGFSGLFGKWVDVDAYNLTFWRMAIAWAALAVFYIIRKKALIPVIDFQLTWKNVLCGVLLAAHWFFFFKVIQLSTVAMGIIFSASFVFMVAALEPLLLKIKPNVAIIASAFVGSIALIVTLSAQAEASHLIIWVYGFLTAGCLAAISLLNRAILLGTNPIDCVTAQLFYGAAALVILGISPDFNLAFLSEVNFGKVALLGILTTAIGHTIYFWSLRYITATKAGVLTLLEPAYAIVFAIIMFKEFPSAEMIIGSTIVICCAAVVGMVSSLSVTDSKQVADDNL